MLMMGAFMHLLLCLLLNELMHELGFGLLYELRCCELNEELV